MNISEAITCLLDGAKLGSQLKGWPGCSLLKTKTNKKPNKQKKKPTKKKITHQKTKKTTKKNQPAKTTTTTTKQNEKTTF